jgi:hypothetical protein
MTDYKATPKQWGSMYEDAFHCDAQSACILELRDRVEALENKSETQYLAILDWGKDVDAIKCWNEQQVRRIEALEGNRPPDLKVYEISEPLQLTPEQAQHVRDLLAPNSKSTPNPSQIRSSLVDRVARAIGWDCEPINWAPEARAAIREVAAWLKETHGWSDGSLMRLEQEAEQ